MTNVSPATPARARRTTWLATLLLAWLPLLAHAATPLLRLEATVITSDVAAFVDQVEIIDATTGLPVRGAVPNTGFETTGSLGAGSVGYNPTGASWTFVNYSGIATNGSGFNNPTAPEGSHVAFLQSGNVGYFSQTLPNLVPGLYRVRLRVAQRNSGTANQGVRVRVDGVDLGSVVPANNGAFAMYNSATFVVARPNTSIIFPGGNVLVDAGDFATPAVTDIDNDGLLDLLVGNSVGNVLRYEQATAGGSFTGGTVVLNVGYHVTPAVTDVDGDGLLDLLVGNQNGTVERYEQSAPNSYVFGALGSLTTNGSTVLFADYYSNPVVTDIDGDGLLDLLVGSQTGPVSRYEQTTVGGSSFALVGNLTTDGSTALDAGTFSAPAITDLDGDGLLDLLVGKDYGTVSRYEQTTVGGSIFAGGPLLTTNGSTALSVSNKANPVVMDMDGDGLLDLLVGASNGWVHRYEQAAPPTALALSPQAVAENAASGTVVGTFATTDANADAGDTFTYTLVTGTGSTDNASFAIGTGANAGKLVTAAVFDFETKSSYLVRVRTTDNAGAFIEQAFTISITDVAEVPVLTSFSPASGALGTVITITGQYLTGLTSVLVGEVPALFTVVSSTSVTVTVPRQATSQKLRISRTSGLAVGQGTAVSATAFAVTRPSTSSIFPGGAALTTDGTAFLDAGQYVVSTVTDVDGDGLLDLLVGNDDGKVLRYEQTTANGSIFAGGTPLTTDGSIPLDVGSAAAPTVTDVDGDGLLDLLVGNTDGNVLRFEQTTPNGSVFAGGTALTTNGSTALDAGTLAAPVMTDVDGDGLLDLLVGNQSGNVLRYEQTVANGPVFAGGTPLTTDGTATLDIGQYATPTVTDVDGNGLLDLLVSEPFGTVLRYEQTLTNGLVFAGGTALTTNGSTALDAGNFIAATVTDVDGDGLLDLLVSNGDGNVLRYEQAAPPMALALSPQAVAENAASGTVVGTFATTDATPGDTFTYTLVTGTGSTDNASFAIGTGTGANAGQLVTAAVFDFETKPSYSIRVRVTDATGYPFEQVFTISITDVVEPPVFTSFSPASGALGSTITLTGQSLTGLTSVLLGEVPTLFTVLSNTSVTVTVPRQATSQKLRISRTGAGTTNEGTAVSAMAFSVTRPGTSIVFPGGAALTTDGSTAIAVGTEATPTVTDLDGDGLLDLLVGNYDGNVLRYEQTTTNGSSFAGGAALTTNGTTALDAGNYVKPVVTDLDGDGLLDLLVGNSDGNVRRYEQTTAGGLIFAGGTALTTDGSTALDAGGYAAPTVTDVDGDGLLDLLLGNGSGQVLRYEQTTANGLIFAGGTALTTNGSTALDVGNYAGPTVTDVDSDGLLDLLLGNTNGRVQRYEQTTAGGLIFAGGAALTTDGSTALDVGDYAIPTVTDVDGDGLLDLLVGNSNNGAQVLRYEQAAPPTALALAPQAVAENAASGTVVGTFTTTDATPGDTFTYTLVSGTGSTDNAQFAIGSGANAGKLVTAAVFDFETKPSYSVRVRTTDALGNFTEQDFTISITDVLEPPTITSFSPASGAQGSILTITGTNFTGTTSVRFGELPAVFVVNSATQLSVTVPRGASTHKLRVTTGGGTALSATAFGVTKLNTDNFPLVAASFNSINVGSASTPAFTDLDGDGLLDLLVGKLDGTLSHYEQTATNAAFALVTASFNTIDIGNYSAPAFTDLDGDGLLDMLVGKPDGQLSHYEQAAANNTTFALVTASFNSIGVGNYSALTFTDLDGDGLLDLLVGKGDGTLSHYEQAVANSTTFALVTASFNTIDVGTYSFPAFVDLDGDGLLDMLVGKGDGTLSHYEQAAANSTTFALVTASFNTIGVGNYSTPAFTDLDGDGLLDLLVGELDGTLNHYEQALPVPAITSFTPGSGPVGTSVTITGTNLTVVTAVTVNGVAGTITGTPTATSLTFVVGAGSSTGLIGLVAPGGTGTSSTSFTVVPLTITALAPTRNLRNAPVGSTVAVTFSQTLQNTAATQGAVQVFSQQRGGRMGGSSRGVASVSGSTISFDPTNDFKPGETVYVTTTTAATSTGGATLARGQVHQFTTATGGTGVGNFVAPALNPTVAVGSSPYSVAVGDVDGDGDLDLLTANYGPNTVSVRLNNGSGSFTAPATNPNPAVGVSPWSVTLGDVDGDGDLDLLTANYRSNTVSVRLNDGTGSFTPPATNPEVAVGSYPYNVLVGDVDGDGDLDLLATGNGPSSGTVSVRLNNGSGNFMPPATNPEVAVGSFPWGLALGDVDGDGDLDLLTVNNDGSSLVHVRLNDGSGNFAPSALTPDVAVVGLPSNVTLGDVDGDGDLDLLTTNYGTNTVSVRLNNGSGSFTAPALNPEVSVASGPSSVTLGDVDGDSDLDLLTNASSGTVSVRLNSGSGNFTPPATNPTLTGGSGGGLALGDVDGDGDLDLLTTGSSNVSVRLNQPPAPVLTSLSSAAELPGMAVVLTGTGFTAGSTVSFGGVAASVTYTSATSLTAVVPVSAAVGGSAVAVGTANGSSSLPGTAFEVLQVYRSTAASGCLSTAPLTLSGSGGAGTWRYLRLPGPGGAVVAAIEDTYNLGTVTAGFQALGTATSDAVRRDGQASRAYLDRNFYLTATSPSFPGQTVRVRFFGLSSELSRLTAVDANATAATLNASQYDGANQNCDLTDNDPNGERRLLPAPATVLTGTDWFTAQVSVADHFSEFYLTGASTPLPVELLAFTAEAKGSAVALVWRTASEKNADRFEVERSRDGRTFERIGTVKAQGSTSAPSAYDFLDHQYPGETNVLYYRLRQFDTDGSASYSPVRVVTVGGKVDFTLYPNPAHAAVTVAGLRAGASVEVFDALGRPVARATADATGTAQLVLPAGLAAGVYILRSGRQARRLTVE